jgi:class 3 adenylate cyclase/tetratricopeptide (TPR) repeat protein
VAHAVFISYAAVDASTAEAVCRTLEAAGIPCWIAPRDVAPGVRYAQAIVDGIRAARAFVLVFSAAASASEQVEREVDRAVAGGLPILPLRIEDVVPSRSLEYYLAGQHWLDALTVPRDESLERLTAAVRALLAAEARTGTQRPAQPSQGAGSAERVEPPVGAQPSRDERKAVTTLFCDLVAFTAMSEAADPEDVDRILGEYFARATKVIESHGGTVEKFIGDAVVGVFGVPAVHEDDPERAVRAGLRLLEALEGMTRPDGTPLEARCGVNTGEALVRLDVDPASGRGFLTGDAVNVAARLQAAAPPGGVAVGATTHDLTAHTVDYEELEPIAAKGKSALVAVFLAKAPISRLGIMLDRERLTALVDRDAELAYLTSLFEKAVASSSPQFALIVGEPGIGKSRLVAELFAYVDARPELITWRQGRCLSYGEGVTFWALGEVVKAQAGILETDDTETAEAKLEPIVPAGPDREWLRNRLRALLGLEAPQAGREENFTAWLRFLEGLAAPGPAVLVFEDLHAADDSLLAFLEFFAGNVDDVPLLVIATARPRLFEKHPAFAASIPRVNRITLERLSDEQTERLVCGLLETLHAPSEVVSTIIRRCEGNPFYAEESARLFQDRVRDEASHVFERAAEGRAGPTDAEAPLPGSVQAVIAARLDTLPPDCKQILADASVVGTVFWSGALAALGQRGTADVDLALHELVAKQLVHRVRDSSMAGESEFAFWHALARDVAYAQLPRAVRAEKHAAAARWIEGKVGERIEELAEVLAHHYATALDLARSAGQKDLVDALANPAVHNLSLAGDHAINLDVAAAERYYSRALELVGAHGAQRPRLLVHWAETLKQGSRFKEAANALEESITALKAAGDTRAAAVAMMKLGEVRISLGDPDVFDLGAEAVALLDDDGPSSERAYVLATFGAGLWIIKCDPPAAIEEVGQAIDMCEQLGLPEPVRALGMRAGARCDLGDLGGLEDYQKAFAAAEAQGLGAERALLYANYSGTVWEAKGPQTAFQVSKEGLEFARRRGIQEYALTLSVEMIEHLCNLGEWDEALMRAADLAPALEAADDVWDLVDLQSRQALLLAWRGEAGKAESFVVWLALQGREAETPWLAGLALLAASAVRLRLGDSEAALGLLGEMAGILRPIGETTFVEYLPEAVRIALAAGDGEVAARLAEGIESSSPLGQHGLAVVSALLAEARGEHSKAASAFNDAASRWHEFGVPFEEAQALLGYGRCLVALGRAPEAAAPLAAAREIFARLGAKPALAETGELMQKVRSA